LENRRVEQVLPGGVGGGRWQEERGRRMNMVLTMYTQVCKCKNDVATAPGIRREGVGERSGGGNSSIIYLIHCKSLCKCYNVPTPSTTVK
jgi:hypothetical protein